MISALNDDHGRTGKKQRRQQRQQQADPLRPRRLFIRPLIEDPIRSIELSVCPNINSSINLSF